LLGTEDLHKGKFRKLVEKDNASQLRTDRIKQYLFRDLPRQHQL
jgi:hypothetical protein